MESLEREIEKLNPEELATFREWFATYDADAWDRQIERDASAGKLNRLAAEALAAHDRGETKAFEAFCFAPVLGGAWKRKRGRLALRKRRACGSFAGRPRTVPN